MGWWIRFLPQVISGYPRKGTRLLMQLGLILGRLRPGDCRDQMMQHLRHNRNCEHKGSNNGRDLLLTLARRSSSRPGQGADLPLQVARTHTKAFQTLNNRVAVIRSGEGGGKDTTSVEK